MTLCGGEGSGDCGDGDGGDGDGGGGEGDVVSVVVVKDKSMCAALRRSKETTDGRPL